MHQKLANGILTALLKKIFDFVVAGGDGCRVKREISFINFIFSINLFDFIIDFM